MVLEQHYPDFNPRQIAKTLGQEISKKNRDFRVSVIPSQAVITDSFPTLESNLFPLSVNVGTFLTASTNNTEPFTQKVDYINGFIKTAEFRSQVREQLPQASNNLIYWMLRPLQFFLLKFFNALFRDQREVNSNIFRALQESLSLNQSLLQEVNSLRSQSQRDFQHIGNVLQDLVTDIQQNQSKYVYQTQQAIHQVNQRLDHNEHSMYQSNQRLDQTEQAIHQANQRLEHTEQAIHQANQHSQQIRHDFETHGKHMEVLNAQNHQETNFLRHDLTQQKRLLTLFLESVQTRLPELLSSSDLRIFTRELTQSSDALYLAFEDQFRGSQEEIYQRLSIYLPYLFSANLRPADDKIVDIGCGRGEWLSLLKKSGYQAMGVDLNKMAIACCQQNQLNAVHGDAIEYLKNLPDDSLGGITGFHIIEHLPFEVLQKLLTESYRVVRPGGMVIFETPNPSNLLVGSCNFYFDPTHRNPIPSLTAKFLLEYTGFTPVTILLLNPSTATPFVEESDLAQRLNQYFYGPMDYAVIAQKSMN